MPGGPTSLGCSACRRQKKKCDAAKPPCPRCARLRIPCEGLGKQRFKFVVAAQGSTCYESNRGLEDGHSLKELLATGGSFTFPPLPHPHILSNATTQLTNTFTCTLACTSDIQYQLPWNFGPFLEEIPRRLGSNEALDCAVDALAAAYAWFRAGSRDEQDDVLRKQMRALGALRRCLDDAEKAKESETLACTMVLLIVEILTGTQEKSAIAHSGGAARILKTRGRSGPKNDFEDKLLLSLRGPVVIQAVLTPNIYFSAMEWKDMVESELDGDSPDGQMMYHFARLPELMRRGREVLTDPWCSVTDHAACLSDLRALHDDVQPVIVQLRDRMGKDSEIAPLASVNYGLYSILRAHFARSYGTAMALAIMIICALGALEDGAGRLILEQESALIADEIIALANIVNEYRPLGTIYMTFCLRVAWVGANDYETRERVQSLLMNFYSDFPRTNADINVEELLWAKRRLELKI